MSMRRELNRFEDVQLSPYSLRVRLFLYSNLTSMFVYDNESNTLTIKILSSRTFQTAIATCTHCVPIFILFVIALVLLYKRTACARYDWEGDITRIMNPRLLTLTL